MELRNAPFFPQSWQRKLLQWVNLRADESERTFLMFAFYTTTSVGLIWLEAVTVGLFLDEYGAASLPLIYIAGAAVGSGLGFFYEWLQEVLPMRRSIVAIALFLAVPTALFRFGLDLPAMLSATIFGMRLWIDGAYVLNDLNTSITANQLFNIREIKRAYPIVSSGILMADVISGFSLGLLIDTIGLENVMLTACAMMVVGAGVLFYLGETYSQAFPDSTLRTDEDRTDYTTRRLQGPLQTYVWLLVTFFVLVEALYVLIDFQFFSELEMQLSGESLAAGIATFLGLFNGILGIFELITQWFASSRLVERIGVFYAGAILPLLVIVIGIISIGGAWGGWLPLFFGIVAIKFVDELFHYTLIEGTGPVLFQPLPESQRNNLQARVNGVAEPLATGVAGVGMWAVITFGKRFFDEASWPAIQSQLFVWIIVAVAIAWVVAIWLMRSRYVELLVFSAERGRLGVSDVDLRALKRSVVETLERNQSEADKRSCVELLTQIDPKNVGEALAPLLESLSPALKCQSLEAMLNYPNPEYLGDIRQLIETPQQPEVLALALRYVWLTEKTPDIQQLQPYLRSEVEPVVRSTAAALIMRKGDRKQKAEATNTLRRMLTHPNERERVMGTQALGEAEYLQGLRLYIPNLLKDDSLRVRCALLEVIASTHFEEYYPSLLRGLYYKSTRDAAMRSLVRLENEVLDPLVALAEDVNKPDAVRMYAWNTIAEIGTPETQRVLVAHLMTAWGMNRRNILRILLKIPGERGIEGVLDRLGRSGVELMIDQELMFLGRIYGASLDLAPLLEDTDIGDIEEVPSVLLDTNTEAGLTPEYAATLLRRSLKDLESDAEERLFLLMRFLYPLSSIQAATFNLKSGSQSSMARGIEILDNTIDIPRKRALLSVLDRQSYREKLQNLADAVDYTPLTPSDRLRRLLELRHFLSDWPLACCYHLARAARIALSTEQTLAGLRHPTGFVRESVLTYLQAASPRALLELLPKMQGDADPLVAAQVTALMAQLGLKPSV
ncbi:MAG: MFS transporter [Geitlerinemataceae cyanobacterium]